MELPWEDGTDIALESAGIMLLRSILQEIAAEAFSSVSAVLHSLLKLKMFRMNSSEVKNLRKFVES